MYKNYIFDFYGTLANIKTEESKDELWEKMSTYFSFFGVGYDPDEMKSKFYKYQRRIAEASGNKENVEINIEDVFFQLFKKKKINPKMRSVKEIARVFRLLSLEKLEVMPYADKVLQKLKDNGNKLYLLADAQSCYIKFELVALGLEHYFDKIYISSEAGLKKPDASVFDQVIKENKLNPKKTVMIGDEFETDIVGANTYGIKSIYIHNEKKEAENMTKKKKDMPTHEITNGDLREVLSITNN